MKAPVPPSLVLVLLLASVGSGRLEAQSWRTVTTSRQIGEERVLDVRVSYGAGRFSVRPASPGTLYRMQLRYDQDLFEPARSTTDGRSSWNSRGLRVSGSGSKAAPRWTSSWRGQCRWT